MIGMDKILLASRGSTGEPAAEGVSFDGVNDYLSRNSDLVGNTDSKTFTFSCWVYTSSNNPVAPRIYSIKSDTTSEEVFRIFVYYNGTTYTRLQISSALSDGTNILYADVTSPEYKNNTWNHILISVDLANTSNRYVYVNDNLASTTWSYYVNSSIEFSSNLHRIAESAKTVNKLKGRLSNLFLAYEYVDLSIESNRRMFITADGKPA